MRLRHLDELGAQIGRFGDIDGNRGAPRKGSDGANVINAPDPVHHDRQPRMVGLVFVKRDGEVLAVGKFEQFDVAGNRIGRIARARDLRVGRIGVSERAIRAP